MSRIVFGTSAEAPDQAARPRKAYAASRAPMSGFSPRRNHTMPNKMRRYVYGRR